MVELLTFTLWIQPDDLDGYLREIVQDEGLAEAEELYVRISGDGRSIARNSDSTILTISVLDIRTPYNCHKQKNLHTLALLEGGEEYNHLMFACKSIDAFLTRLMTDGFAILPDGPKIPTKIYL